jgi:aminomethyltransferase
MTDYLKTALHSFHINSCAKMAPFAGYDMPIQYSTGVLKEHNWVRDSVGIFDVSHMGQYILEGEKSAEFLSHITPSPFKKMPLFKSKYTVLTNTSGGIIDDLIVTRLADDKFYLVLNAACKENDIKWLTKHLPTTCNITELNKSLVAIQGPKAVEVLQKYTGLSLDDFPFMSVKEITIQNMDMLITRSGYTGEDGFEISLQHQNAQKLWKILLTEEDVLPIGLAARDSLRLEAGFPLYGHDLNEKTSPIEASMAWLVSKKSTGFIGAERIINERENGAKRYRVGIELQEKGIAREGSKICNAKGEKIGFLTSGTFSPTLKKAIGQGYIDAKYAEIGTKIYIEIRGKQISALTHSLSFIKSKTTSTKKRNKNL